MVALATVHAGHTEECTMKFMRLSATVSSALIAGALLAALAGCQNEGPGQKAGKAVDNATDKAGQQIEKAGDNIQDDDRGNK
jgi:predicted small lipoprotein YifL